MFLEYLYRKITKKNIDPVKGTCIKVMLLIFLSLPIKSFSQNYYSENITIKDGLPSNTIRDIFKDSRGFMWYGTGGGLVRYDGSDFKIFNERDGLAGNRVWSIDEDDYGNLWLGTWGGGVSCFDGQNFKNYTEKDGLTDNWIRKIYYSHHFDCVVIGSNHGLSVLKDSTIYKLIESPDLNEKEVVVTEILENDRCIEVYDYSHQHHHVEIVIKNDKPTFNKIPNQALEETQISSAMHSKNGQTFYGLGRYGVMKETQNGLTIYDSIGQVFSFSEDQEGNIWAAAWESGGGGLFKIEGNNIEPYNPKLRIKSTKGFSSYYDTVQNILWYGTLDNGIYKIPERLFSYYDADYFHQEELKVKELNFDENNNLWLLCNDAIFQMLPNQNLKIYDLDFFTKDIDLNQLNYYKIPEFRSLRFTGKEEVLVSIIYVGLFKLNLNSGHAKLITPDINENFILDGSHHLYSYEYWKDDVGQYNIRDGGIKLEKEFFSKKPVQAVKSFFNQNKWFLSRLQGVYYLAGDTILSLNEKIPSLSSIINHMCFDEKHAYLAGNDGTVVIIKQESKTKIAEISIKGNNKPVQWLEKVKTKLLVGYSDMIAVYDATNLQSISAKPPYIFDETEGFKPQNIHFSKKDNHDNIWLATDNGIVKISTDHLIESRSKPLITYIINIEINNKPVDWSEFSQDKRFGLINKDPNIELNHKQKNIRFNFRTLNYLNPDKDRYFHYTEGLYEENQPPTATHSNHVDYLNLNPGQYEFNVYSTNKNTGLESKESRLSFEILAPWYRTWWFLLIALIAVFLGFVMIWNYRINRIKKKEEEKRKIGAKIAELETKALQAQMNPHFIFNSLNSIQSFILNDESDKALRYLADFSKLVRTTLDYINKKQITLNEEITYLENYIELEKARFRLDLKCAFIVSDELDPEIDKIPPMLLQPLIENSIKHGFIAANRNNKIKVEFKLTFSGNLKCSVEDNGIGRAASKTLKSSFKSTKKESFGLKIIEERLKHLNNKGLNKQSLIIKDLSNEDGRPAGTRIALFISRKEGEKDVKTS